MNTASPSLGPAERLEGVVLSGKWCVQQQLRRDYGATGETRSCGYLAHSIDTKQLAFVKAFDFHRAELEGDTDHLEMMVREFNYERDVHKLVGSSRLSRVTRFYEAGKINIAGRPFTSSYANGPMGVIENSTRPDVAASRWSSVSSAFV